MNPRQPSTRQRVVDTLWAALSAALAVWALVDGWQHGNLQQMVFFALHLQSAVLFLIRHPETARAQGWTGYAVAVASTFYVYAYEFPPPELGGQSMLAGVLTVTGAALVFTAKWSLGRKFGVLPIVRGVATGGAYAVVRHPIYAAYVVMDLGIVLALPSVRNGVVALLGVVLYVWRIGFEEGVLEQSRKYREYQARVPFKMVPGLF